MAQAATPQSPGDTGERILEAALAAFAEQGYDGATTREIAARAGVNLGLLQYHFGGKPKLWRAAVDRAFADLREGLRGVLAADASSPAEHLRLLIRGHVSFVAERPEFVRIMHDEGKRRGARMRWLVDRHVRPLYEDVVPLIQRCQQAGVLPADVPAYHFSYALVGAVGLFFHQAEECKRLTGTDPSAPAAVAAHSRAVEHLFLGPDPEERR